MNISESSPVSGEPRPPKRSFDFSAMEGAPTWLACVDHLLKKPGRVLYQMLEPKGSLIALGLAAALAICLAAFGLLLGSFSGGEQLWRAPAKVILGVAASGLICLPSLYIFAALSGVDCRLKQVAGMMLVMLALMGMLLLGFCPVVWVFAQSSSSSIFMGSLGIIVFCIALAFGFGLLHRAASKFGLNSGGHLTVWKVVFVLVAFQMTSSLRPILGQSESFLPAEKKFFLQHWFESANVELKTAGKRLESSRD